MTSYVKFALFSAWGMFLSNAAAYENILIGNVFDNTTKAFLYQEEHRFIQGGIRTAYTDIEGSLIGGRLIALNEGRVVRYELSQPQIAFQESVLRNPDGLILKRSLQGDEKSKQIAPRSVADVVIDAGFSNYIVRNWDALIAGEKATFNFASVAQLDVVKLQLKRSDVAKSSLARNGDPEGVVMFEMNIANPLLRLLLKPIEVGYYEDSKQLAYYQGVSNLKDQNGEQIESVHVLFEPQKPVASTASN